MAENQDRFFECAELFRLRKRVDGEPVDVVSNCRRDQGGAVSVGVGLHDRHERGVAEA
jgi:hypothetical protein